MTHAYESITEDVAQTYRRIHANGEETRVHIISAGDRYAVVAVDIDPREFEAVAGETIAYSPTQTAAEEQAVAWMEQHPRGIAADSSDGLGSKLFEMLKKLDQSAQQDMEDTHES